MLPAREKPRVPIGLAPAAKGEHPNWSQIPFNVPCLACGEPLNGVAQSRCDECHSDLDWNEVLPVQDLRCRHCEYQLLGLTEQRCPECGAPFEWTDVLRFARQGRSNLFEHVWRRRPLDALGRTWFQAAFLPRRLWTKYERCSSVGVPALLAFMILQWVVFVYGWDAVGAIADLFMNTLAPLVGSTFRFTYQFRVGPNFMEFMALWYVATFFCLQVFHVSKRRYGVGWRRILRVYVHSTAFASLIPAISCLLEMLLDCSLLIQPDLSRVLNSSQPNPYVVLRDSVFALGVLGTVLLIWLGYRTHLRHPRGWGVAATSLVLGYYLARLVMLYS